MCFYIDPNNPEPLITEKEIKVYKMLNAVNKKNKILTGWSPFKEFEWYKDRVCDAKFSYDGCDIIEKGFHAYYDFKKAKENVIQNTQKHFLPNFYICEFIIPKGVKYYIDSLFGEIVCERIFWTGRINRSFLGFNFWSKIITNNKNEEIVFN